MIETGKTRDRERGSYTSQNCVTPWLIFQAEKVCFFWLNPGSPSVVVSKTNATCVKTSLLAANTTTLIVKVLVWWVVGHSLSGQVMLVQK